MSRLHNQYPGRCRTCRGWIPAGEGYLLGRDEMSGYWDLRCDACEEEAHRAAREACRLTEEARRQAKETEELYWRLRAVIDGMEADRTGRGGAPACLRILGLVPPTDALTIKRRYRELAMVHHPDKGGDAKQFVTLQEAYAEAMGRVGGAA